MRMTAFGLLPVTVQNFVCFWSMVVCLGGIAAGISLLRQKRYAFCVWSALCFAAGYVILHFCMEGTLLRLRGIYTELTLRLMEWPWAVFVVILVADSLACLRILRNARRWQGTHITAASIKESVDGLPAGVCYYLEDGRCIMINHRMNEICFSLMGYFLQNAEEFYESVKEKTVHALSDGTAVSFRHRVLSFEGVPLHELIADDITELYEKSEELRVDNEKAQQLAAGMKAYGDTIADTVLRQEILQAKANIHDEMNRMILATRKSALGEADEGERREILRMWQGQALLLGKEAEVHRSRSVVSDLNALAAVLGMRIRWDGTPATEEVPVLTLFLAAAREAAANAAKHAGAATLTIHVSENTEALCAVFENEGKLPTEPLRENGGLLILRQRLENAGGEMTVETDDRFRLKVTIPKEENRNAV